jgi:hypothetical protein
LFFNISVLQAPSIGQIDSVVISIFFSWDIIFFFVPQNENYSSGGIAISLIYTYKQVEYEVAIFAFNPVLNGPA